MTSRKLSEAKLREIQEVAAGWGELLASESFASGPGLDVTLADMEDVAAAATQALVRGALEEMTDRQAQGLGDHTPCPTCGTLCKFQRKKRDVTAKAVHEDQALRFRVAGDRRMTITNVFLRPAIATGTSGSLPGDDESDERPRSLSCQGCPATGLRGYDTWHYDVLVASGSTA